MAARQDKKQQQRKRRSGPPLLEWISGGIGVLLTLGLLSVIAVDAVRNPASELPRLVVQPIRLTKMGDLYVVEVSVRNLASSAAASVRIEGKLGRAGTGSERAETTLSYVPGYSERRAGLVFAEDPRRLGLQVRAAGFEEP